MSSTSVKILTTHKKHHANKSSLTKIPCPIPLGPFDHLLPPWATIAVVFVWRQPLNNDPIISLDLLHKALSRLLDFYPHLTGRVHINAQNGSTEIHELEKGAELRSATCESSLPHDVEQLSPEDLPGEGTTLLPKFNDTDEGFLKEPMLNIQHTRFGCGSVSLGVRLCHSVCDVHGFLQVMEDLAEIYRGLRGGVSLHDVQLQQMPCIKSYLSDVDLSPVETETALDVQPADYRVEEVSTAMTFKSDKPVTGKLLHFSRDELVALKDAASNASQGEWVSTFEALSAHLWLSVQRARAQHQKLSGLAVDAEETADLLTSLDWRSPTRLNLPPRYFPNAVSEPYITLPLDNLSHATLPQTAQTIHSTLRSRTPTSQQETLRWVKAQPSKSKIALRTRFNENGFIISQWNKLDMYGVYFDTDGQGKCILPDRAWPPFTEASLADGLAYFLPVKGDVDVGVGESGIEVALSLNEAIWEVLEKDLDFRGFRG